MASSLPPVKGSAFTFPVALVSQADTDIFKTSVTLAAGDVKVSKDFGAFANVGTLPTEIGTSGVLSCPLSADEMNADVVVVKFSDAAGSEWQDALVTIYTAAQTLDTTDGVVDGVASSLAAGMDVNVAKINMSETAAQFLQDALDGDNTIDLYANLTGSVAGGVTVTTISSNVITADALADDAIAEINATVDTAISDAALATAAAISALNDLAAQDVRDALKLAPSAGTPAAGSVDKHLDDLIASSTIAGAIAHLVTIDDGSNPLDGAEVWITTDSGGSNTVASGTTDALGQVTFYLDAGSYYLWVQLSGYNFSNPTAITVR